MEKNNGVKEPDSTCITRALYFLFFSASCFFRMVFSGALICEAVLAFVMRMSKYAFWPRRQKPLARTSRRALALVLALLGRCSLEIVCKEFSFKVSDVVMTCSDEATSLAIHGMRYVERLYTHAY